jgi:hypothetical protein
MHDQAGGDEQHGDLRAGDGGDQGQDDADRPQPQVAAVGHPGQLVRGHRDDRHNGGGDPGEQGLHHGQAPIVGVQDGHGQDQQERGGDERHRGRQRPEGAGAQEAQPHHHLRGQRPGHGLAEGDAVQEVFAGQPGPAFDQVALHVADRGDGPPNPQVPSPRK